MPSTTVFTPLRTVHIAILMAALFVAPLQWASAQTAHQWNGGNGFWKEASNWSSGVMPNSNTADVLIDGAGADSVVMFGTGSPNYGMTITAGRLVIDAGDKVEFTESSNLLNIDNSAFTGAGEILLNGQLLLPFDGNSLGGTKTFNGSGKVVFGSVGRTPEWSGHTTNNLTIEGSGQFGRYNSTRHQMFNNAIVNANIPGQHILFHVLDTPSTNIGTMQATDGGVLALHQGAWNNTGGTIVADGVNPADPPENSLVWFSAGNLLEGGTVSAINGGKLRVGGQGNFFSGATWRNVTASAPPT